MLSIVSGSIDTDLSNLWTVEQMRKNLQCEICYRQDFNFWYCCIRRNALVNLHNGFASRPRQMYFLILAIAKYTPVPVQYQGPFFRFRGNLDQIIPAEQTSSTRSPVELRNVGVRVLADLTGCATQPKSKHEAKVVAYGK